MKAVAYIAVGAALLAAGTAEAQQRHVRHNAASGYAHQAYAQRGPIVESRVQQGAARGLAQGALRGRVRHVSVERRRFLDSVGDGGGGLFGHRGSALRAGVQGLK